MVVNCIQLCPCNLLQPALYEAFGLTVVEAMICGLPTFATCHGGPAEIIEHGTSGFHIDPHHPDQVAQVLVNFFEQCQHDPGYWNKISDAGICRIHERSASTRCMYTSKDESSSAQKLTYLSWLIFIGIHGRYILRGS